MLLMLPNPKSVNIRKKLKVHQFCLPVSAALTAGNSLAT